MDKGCHQVCTLVKEHLPLLQILDLAGCFLTKVSFIVLEKLLEHIAPLNQKKEEEIRRHSMDEPLYYMPEEVVVLLEPTANPHLREILLQENMFTLSQFTEFCTEYPQSILACSTCKLNIGNSKYLGVGFPLGYSLQDYGIAEYVL